MHINDRRRETRERCEFPIEVSGFDAGREFFTEQTITLDVSPCGCRFLLRTPVELGSVVAIRSLHAITPHAPMPTVLFQIVYTQPADLGSIVGVSRLHAGPTWVTLPMAG